jgi:hypothetical protein
LLTIAVLGQGKDFLQVQNAWELRSWLRHSLLPTATHLDSIGETGAEKHQNKKTRAEAIASVSLLNLRRGLVINDCSNHFLYHLDNLLSIAV